MTLHRFAQIEIGDASLRRTACDFAAPSDRRQRQGSPSWPLVLSSNAGLQSITPCLAAVPQTARGAWGERMSKKKTDKKNWEKCPATSGIESKIEQTRF